MARAFAGVGGEDVCVPGPPPRDEELVLFDWPGTYWPGGPDPRSLARDDDQEGGAFAYENCPEIFFGRRGIGPMRVAVDTSVLIDYAEFGQAIWSDEPFEPKVPSNEHRDQLHALDGIMSTWMTRDIRFHVFDRQVDDCRKAMSAEQTTMRLKQVVQLQSALRCVEQDTVDLQPPPGEAWPPPPDLSRMPANMDRELVALAIESGCHVFLTRDKGLLRKADDVAAHWVAVLSPAGLLDALAAADELGFTGAGDLLLPDTHKWSHVMGACGSP